MHTGLIVHTSYVYTHAHYFYTPAALTQGREGVDKGRDPDGPIIRTVSRRHLTQITDNTRNLARLTLEPFLHYEVTPCVYQRLQFCVCMYLCMYVCVCVCMVGVSVCKITRCSHAKDVYGSEDETGRRI